MTGCDDRRFKKGGGGKHPGSKPGGSFIGGAIAKGTSSGASSKSK